MKKTLFIVQLILMLFYGCKSNSQQTNIVDNKMGNRLDSLISAEEKQGFHGVVFVELDGKEALSKGYGFANESTQLKFSPSTFVQIGSGVKDFTKVAIYQLAENGKLSLTDPLSKVMPGLTGSKQKITVQHLLEHRAGFSLGEKTDEEPFTTAEMIAAVQTLTLKAEPGTKEIYSNLGYSCLAYIVEQVSGKPFDKYVYDHILQPIRLVQTGTYIPKYDRANVAHGYNGDGKDIGIILDMPHDDNGHLWSLRGNGGYLSTTGEINKFFHSLENNSLLKTESFRKEVFNPANPTVLAGSDMVSFFMISNMPMIKARIIIASNHSNYKAPKLLRKIEEVLLSGNKNNTGNRKAERQIDLGDETEEGKQKYTGPLLEKLPETEAGITIQKYFEAFNTGDAEKMRNYFEAYAKKHEAALPIEQRLKNYKNLYADLGKITFVNLNASQSSEGIWDVSVTTSTGSPAKFVFQIETQSPWKFIGLQIKIGD
jgi:CubicO group peptidase (beta-lactamase class C family)